MSMGDKSRPVAGTMPQKIKSCLSTLDILLSHQYPICSSMVLAAKETKSSTEDSGKSLVDAVAHVLGTLYFMPWTHIESHMLFYTFCLQTAVF